MLFAMSDDERYERTVVRAIGVCRIVWGTILAVAPGTVHRVLGASYPGEDFGVWVKVFGVRDIVVGAGALSSDPALWRPTLRAGIVMDLVDAAIVADATRRGLPARAAGPGLTLAGGTAVVGMIGPALLRRANRG
jgi:hypothetical protein